MSEAGADVDAWIDTVDPAVLSSPPTALWQALVDAIPLASMAKPLAAAAGVHEGEVDWRTGGTAWHDILERATRDGHLRDLLRSVARGRPAVSQSLAAIMSAPASTAPSDPVHLRNRTEVEHFAKQGRSAVVFHAGPSDYDVLVRIARWQGARARDDLDGPAGAIGRAELLDGHPFDEREPCVVFYREGLMVERIAHSDARP